MLSLFASIFLFLSCVVARPVEEATAASSYQIRGVSSPIFHLYLQALPSSASTPVLGPAASGEYFTIGSTIQSTNTSNYLNIGTASTSYKPLSFSKTSNTTAWALEGDTIITATASTYGRQLNFVACQLTGGYYSIYLQTGSDVPSGTCSNFQTLHLPCLC
ncbi:hypothetical protein AOQ84DRAFT_425915 [Glonium stellatum]|uniref:Uncharacterized protein n=1 Tax=Glonium stellatum TaxID=574774 RepID=A0A8E2FCS7_9PEZI|nr:hypothetical protein AOQ84DRAFT_425915 [Glonium stellatum]